MIWNTLIALHAAPAAIWFSGALEGAVRCCYDIARVGFSHEKKAATNDFYRNVRVTKSCLLITAVSIPPVLGTYFGYRNLIEEEFKYLRIVDTVRALRFSETTQSKRCYTELMEGDVSLDDRKALLTEYENGEEFHLQDLNTNLENSLVNQYAIFYLSHVGMRIPYRGLNAIVQISSKIFHALKKQRATYYVLSGLIHIGRFTSEVLIQELEVVLE